MMAASHSMQSIAIYGKGGVGKSMIATNLSAYYATQGKKVLHIGCDPKHDSAVRLMDNNLPLRTVLEVVGDDPALTSADKLINAGRMGIDCCESGGPPPGQGCGGRGVAKTLEFLGELDIFNSGKYDVVMFDVLGDVVCGGFAAPLRMGYARKILIVVSEEPMALFAANNICKAIRTYTSNGIVLGGLIANLRTNDASRDFLDSFAKKLDSRILAFVPRDQLVQAAERQRKTVIEQYPESETGRVFSALGDEILNFQTDSIRLPNPMSDEVFFDFIRG